MKQDHRSKPCLESASRLSQGFNLGVVFFSGTVADSMLEKDHNPVSMVIQRLGSLFDWLQPAVGGPEIPSFPVLLRPGATLAMPQADIFSDRPGTSSFQVSGPQTPKEWALLGQVFLGLQSEVFVADQDLAFAQCLMLLFPHRIHRLVDMLHQVVAVEDDFVVCVGQLLMCSGYVRLGHIHGHRLNADQRHDFGRFTCHIPGHRPFSQVPGLIPTDSQNRLGHLGVGLPQHIDGNSFKQRLKPRMQLRPRQPHVANPVFEAIHSGRPRVKKGLKLAAVQVAPDPLFCTIVQRSPLAALWTRPLVHSRMFQPAGRQRQVPPVPRTMGPPVPTNAGKNQSITYGSPPWFLDASVT